jgi:hypothetical protein
VETVAALWLLGAAAYVALLAHAPGRYQIIVLPPLYLLAGMAVGRAVDRGPVGLLRDRAGLAVTATACIYLGMRWASAADGHQSPLASQGTTTVLAAIVAALVVVAAGWALARVPARGRDVVAAAALAAGLVTVLPSHRAYHETRRDTMPRFSRELGHLLGEGSSLIGPWAGTMGLENRFPVRTIFHFHAEDPALLEETGATHLIAPVRHRVVEKLQAHHPEAMEGAILLTRTQIGIYTLDLIRLSTAGPPTPFEAAAALLQAGRLPEAEAEARRHLSDHPESVEARRLLAAVLGEAGRHADAARALREAVDLSPRDPLLRQELGGTLLRTGRREEAMEELRTALALEPLNASLRQALAGAG